MSIVKIAFEISFRNGPCWTQFFLQSWGKNFVFNFQLNSRLNVINLYFWAMAYKRINWQEFRGLPEPAESKFYLSISPESNALEENVGKVAFTI